MLCLLVSIHICVLIFLQRGLEGVYQKNSLNLYLG